MTKRYQLQELILQLTELQLSNLNYALDDAIESEVKHLFYEIAEDFLDYDSYLTICDDTSEVVFVCVKATYARLNDDPNNIIRTKENLIVFDSLQEMELHMVISEYENQFDPNPILFN